MRQVRAEHGRTGVRDPWNGVAVPVGGQDTVHLLSRRQGLTTLTSGVQIACGCGCLRPPAGFCSTCTRTACCICYGFCLGCGRPLGRCHSVFIAGTNQRLCGGCADSQRRRGIIRSVTRFVLAPFVEFGDRRGSR